jgi:hypothetical protein
VRTAALCVRGVVPVLPKSLLRTETWQRVTNVGSETACRHEEQGAGRSSALGKAQWVRWKEKKYKMNQHRRVHFLLGQKRVGLCKEPIALPQMHTPQRQSATVPVKHQASTLATSLYACWSGHHGTQSLYAMPSGVIPAHECMHVCTCVRVCERVHMR